MPEELLDVLDVCRLPALFKNLDRDVIYEPVIGLVRDIGVVILNN